MGILSIVDNSPGMPIWKSLDVSSIVAEPRFIHESLPIRFTAFRSFPENNCNSTGGVIRWKYVIPFGVSNNAPFEGYFLEYSTAVSIYETKESSGIGYRAFLTPSPFIPRRRRYDCFSANILKAAKKILLTSANPDSASSSAST